MYIVVFDIILIKGYIMAFSEEALQSYQIHKGNLLILKKIEPDHLSESSFSGHRVVVNKKGSLEIKVNNIFEQIARWFGFLKGLSIEGVKDFVDRNKYGLFHSGLKDNSLIGERNPNGILRKAKTFEEYEKIRNRPLAEKYLGSQAKEIQKNRDQDMPKLSKNNFHTQQFAGMIQTELSEAFSALEKLFGVKSSLEMEGPNLFQANGDFYNEDYAPKQ